MTNQHANDTHSQCSAILRTRDVSSNESTKNIDSTLINTAININHATAPHKPNTISSSTNPSAGVTLPSASCKVTLARSVAALAVDPSSDRAKGCKPLSIITPVNDPADAAMIIERVRASEECIACCVSLLKAICLARGPIFRDMVVRRVPPQDADIAVVRRRLAVCSDASIGGGGASGCSTLQLIGASGMVIMPAGNSGRYGRLLSAR